VTGNQNIYRREVRYVTYPEYFIYIGSGGRQLALMTARQKPHDEIKLLVAIPIDLA
jgi:hypothetical protein